MKFKIVVKNYSLEQSVSDFLEKKLSKLDKFFEKDVECRVYLKIEKKLHKVEVEFTYQSKLLRAEEKAETFYDAIDAVIPKLERQIIKQRAKNESKYNKNTFDQEENLFDDSFKLVKTKQFEIDPQSLEDAINEFEQRGYNFYVFLDEKDGRIKVLYLRDDGNVALIDPIITK